MGARGSLLAFGKPQLRRLQPTGRPIHVRYEVRKLCCSLEDGQRHGERSMGTGACWRRLRPATRTMAARQNCAYRVHCMAAVGAPERCPAPARSFCHRACGLPKAERALPHVHLGVRNCRAAPMGCWAACNRCRRHRRSHHLPHRSCRPRPGAPRGAAGPAALHSALN